MLRKISLSENELMAKVESAAAYYAVCNMPSREEREEKGEIGEDELSEAFMEGVKWLREFSKTYGI